MAVLPSRPGSACFGRERLAVDRRCAPGELAALSADPEAAGTTASDGTPLPAAPCDRHDDSFAAPISPLCRTVITALPHRWHSLAALVAQPYRTGGTALPTRWPIGAVICGPMGHRVASRRA